MSTSSHYDLHALTGAYAVDAVDEVERARFERHLDECPECVAEIRTLREAAALVSYETPPLPSALRDRVLGAVGEVRPLPPVVPHEAVGRTARRFPRLVAAAAAALILVAGVGIGSWHPWGDASPSEITAASRVLDSADADQSSAALSTGGRATVVHSARLGRVVVMTEGLPPAAKNRVYELWLQDDKGVLHASGALSGGADTTVVLSHAVNQATGLGITLEPVAGATQPSSAPLALFSFSQA